MGVGLGEGGGVGTAGESEESSRRLVYLGLRDAEDVLNEMLWEEEWSVCCLGNGRKEGKERGKEGEVKTSSTEIPPFLPFS